MANPSPKTEHLRSVRPDQAEIPVLARKQFSVRVAPEVAEVLAAMPDRAIWLRRVVTAAAKAEGLV